MAMTTETSDAYREAGRRLFAGEARFVMAAPALVHLPPEASAEIAFAGRSNVGKSSLINALTARKALARTSHTPGRTQDLNIYRIGPPQTPLTVVDMPGYGYAAVSKAKVAAWTRLIQDYLKGRPQLARVYLLVDARHGLKDADADVLSVLDRAAVSYQVVLTKADAVKAEALATLARQTQAALARHPAAHPQLLATSSRSGLGVPELRAAIAQLIQERAGASAG
jgi:GTP-binding protein